jgi:hypothetical protein
MTQSDIGGARKSTIDRLLQQREAFSAAQVGKFVPHSRIRRGIIHYDHSRPARKILQDRYQTGQSDLYFAVDGHDYVHWALRHSAARSAPYHIGWRRKP